MAVSRCQAVVPRRRLLATVIAFLQVAILGSALLVPVPLVSAALQSNTLTEEHEEIKPVCRQKRTSQRKAVLHRCFDTLPLAAVAVCGRIADRLQRTCIQRPEGHRLANGLLAPLTC